MYKDWRIGKIPETQRIDFIIKCLTEYLDEVELLGGEEGIGLCHPEVIDTANLYRDIILKMEELKELRKTL